MSETVGTSEQTEQIQNYIEGAAPSGSGGDGSAEYYTIEEKQIAGNILIAQGETSGQAENVYMVMDGQDQQFIMISYDQSGRPTGPVAEHVLVAPSEGEATTVTVVEPAEVVATRSGRPKRQTRGMLRAMQFKEETNDISVYDFTDMNVPARGGGGAEAGQEDAPSGEQDKGAGSATEDEDTDADYVKPAPAPKRIGRPPKAVTAKRSKAAASSSAAVVVGNAANASVSGNVHVCTYCNYTSNKRYLLSRHLKSHSEDRPHKCGICERGFKTLASLQNHVNTHTGVRPHSCKFCDAAFTTSGELVRHIRYRHTHEKPHRCNECDYASVELSKLKRHMRCHTGERPYQCPHCTYASPDTYKLKRHLRIHTGEKPYVCDVCHQRFTQSNSLKAHRLIHTGNKPVFKCDYCPTTCGRKTDLRIHVQKLHTSDKILTCKRCDQSFPDRYQFKLHLKSHEGEKCFKCDLCSYASVSARHLDSHMLIHTDQKPFICEVCTLSFRQKQLLKRHKNLYHNPAYVPPVPKEKTHECQHCSKAFRHKGNLIRHLSLHDPDAKNNPVKNNHSVIQSALIDDEIYEDEDDDVEMGEGAIGLGNDSSMEQYQITIEGDTITSDNQEEVVMLVYEGENQQSPANGGEEVAQAEAGAVVTAVATQPATSTPRIIARRGRAAKQANARAVTVVVPATAAATAAASADTSVTIEGDTSRVEVEKQKDIESCFGFKDEEDEDDIILSMPAVHTQ